MAIATFDTLLQNKSIRIDHIDFATDDLSGDYISGGTITDFSSTGIIDEATNTIVHLDDTGLSVDNLVTNNLEVDNITVSGKMTVKNMTIEFQQEEIGTDVRLHKAGLIHIGNDCVLSRNELGPGVVYSNLRKVGRLTNLTVDGHFQAGYTLYANEQKNVVGINTEEPIGALHVRTMDGGEVLIDGDGSDSYIGTVRNSSLMFGTDILRSNKPAHLTITTEGSVGVGTKNPDATLEVNGDFKFSGVKFTSGYEKPAPGFHNRSEIIWNQDPVIGDPVGWVCIEAGDPGIWAKFGIIE